MTKDELKQKRDELMQKRDELHQKGKRIRKQVKEDVKHESSMRRIESNIILKIHDTWNVCCEEFRRIFHDPGVIVLFFVAVLAYPLLYNALYIKNALTEVPVAVVDMDHSTESRQYIHDYNATSEVEVTHACASMAEAEYLLKHGKVHVFVYNEDRHAEVTMLEACRRGDKMLELRVPEKWKEERLHVYVAVSDAKEKTFGNSQYFGFDGRSVGVMKVGDWTKVLGEELMMGLEKGEVMGVTGYEVVGKVDLSKPYRFNGANWRDTRMNSLGLALEQSAIYTGMGHEQYSHNIRIFGRKRFV